MVKPGIQISQTAGLGSTLVPGTWYQAPCTRNVITGPWYQLPATRHPVPGSWYYDYGTRTLVPENRYHESYLILVPQVVTVYQTPSTE
jgi:hypothetical protein